MLKVLRKTAKAVVVEEPIPGTMEKLKKAGDVKYQNAAGKGEQIPRGWKRVYWPMPVAFTKTQKPSVTVWIIRNKALQEGRARNKGITHVGTLQTKPPTRQT